MDPDSHPRPHPPRGFTQINEGLLKGGPCFLIDKPGGRILNLGLIISETSEKVTFRSGDVVSKDDFKYLIPVFCGDGQEIIYHSHRIKNEKIDRFSHIDIDRGISLMWLLIELMDAQRELREVIKMNPTTAFGIYQRERANGILEKNHKNEIMSIIGNLPKEKVILILSQMRLIQPNWPEFETLNRLTSEGIRSMLENISRTIEAVYIYGPGETFYGFDEYIAPPKVSSGTVPQVGPSGASCMGALCSGNSSASSRGGRGGRRRKSIKAKKVQKSRKGKKAKKQSRRRV